jgi:hypothetical protein
MTARRVLLDGLARDADIFELVSELAPLHPRDNTFPGEVFLGLAADALNWCGASRADPLPLEGLRERFLPERPSAAGKTRSSSTPCWPQQPAMAGPNRTCSMRSRGGRPATSGSTRCSRRSPTSAPPPAGRACRCGRHARTSASALAIQHHNDHFGTQPKRSSDDAAADHNGGTGRYLTPGLFTEYDCHPSASSEAAWRALMPERGHHGRSPAGAGAGGCGGVRLASPGE